MVVYKVKNDNSFFKTVVEDTVLPIQHTNFTYIIKTHGNFSYIIQCQKPHGNFFTYIIQWQEKSELSPENSPTYSSPKTTVPLFSLAAKKLSRKSTVTISFVLFSLVFQCVQIFLTKIIMNLEFYIPCLFELIITIKSTTES